MASNGWGTPCSVPAVSARGKHNKETFRDMILKAVDYLERCEKRGATFKSISDFIDRTFHVRNDFIIRHQLKQLVCWNILCKKGSKYGIKVLKFSAEEDKNIKRRSKKSKGSKSKKKKQSKRRKQRKRKKYQRRSSRKRQKKRKLIC